VAFGRPSGVLICVHGEVVEIPAVAAALRDRWGVEPLLFDPVRFPAGCGLSAEYAPGGELVCAGDGREWQDIGAIWQGVVVGGERGGDGGLGALDDATRRTCIAASEMALLGVLDSLEVFQLDPHASAARAGSKPFQLRIAPAVGLEIPRTLIGNDPDAVRAFARRCGGLVTKMLVQPAASDAEAGQASVFTAEVSEADLADLDGLRLCPMIFQERIEKAADVRVTVVGRQVLAAALESRAGPDPGGEGDIDWRRAWHGRGERPGWAPCELPADVAAALVRMLDHLGLNIGACDLVRTPEGRHVFLELNPFGSFCFLGPACADPIAAAIADVLVDPGARRVPAPARAARVTR